MNEIRIVSPLFDTKDNRLIPTSPKQLEIGVIGIRQARLLNELWHSRFPKTDESNMLRSKRNICFGAVFDGLFYACAIWTSPIAANRLKDGELLLELRRMAISDDAPRNTATRMLSLMISAIKKKWPELIGLVSYQDTEVHTGTIYKAGNWKQETTCTLSDWTTKTRVRNVAQSIAPKTRWRYELRANK